MESIALSLSDSSSFYFFLKPQIKLDSWRRLIAMDACSESVIIELLISS